MRKNKLIQKAGKNSNQLQVNTLVVNNIYDLSKKKLYSELVSGMDFSSVPLIGTGLDKNESWNLDKLEKINMVSLFYTSLMPWKRSYGLPFGEVCSTPYCIDPYIKTGGLSSNGNEKFSAIENDIRNHNCIVLGDAGSGKSFVLRKTCMEMLVEGRHALYISSYDWNNGSVIAKYVNDILEKRTIPPNDLLVVFDGIDEVFATDHKNLAQLINKAINVNCTICFGCRTDFYDSAQCFQFIPFKSIYIQNWNLEQALQYVNEHTKKTKAKGVLEKFKLLVQEGNNIESFYKNPLRLSMLIYILECNIEKSKKDQVSLGNNEYLLYSLFFKCWISNELGRLDKTQLKEDIIIGEWQKIARTLYIDRYSEVQINNNPILISILKVTEFSQDVFRVDDFLHRSFMEFLLAKEAIDSMLTSPQAIINSLKNNNRSDVDYYIKNAFKIFNYHKKNKIISNLVLAYGIVSNENIDESECFYVQNQIVYYLTRMNSSSEKIKSFIKDIYANEKRPIMCQGIAYGAANIGLLDIALDFAKKMDDPESLENLTNRAWTLVFYGDQPDEDPLEYKDIHNSSWTRSKEARLRRLKGNKIKEQAFRMFDLCILHGFYESRGWNEMAIEELEVIESTETEISGYGEEVRAFLRKKKQDLIDNYMKHNKY